MLLQNIGLGDSEIAKKFEDSIIRCEKISKESFDHIVNSIEKKYTEFDLVGLSEERINSLISGDILELTEYNFDSLKKNSSKGHILLI